MIDLILGTWMGYIIFSFNGFSSSERKVSVFHHFITLIFFFHLFPQAVSVCFNFVPFFQKLSVLKAIKSFWQLSYPRILCQFYLGIVSLFFQGRINNAVDGGLIWWEPGLGKSNVRYGLKMEGTNPQNTLINTEIW